MLHSSQRHRSADSTSGTGINEGHKQAPMEMTRKGIITLGLTLTTKHAETVAIRRQGTSFGSTSDKREKLFPFHGHTQFETKVHKLANGRF